MSLIDKELLMDYLGLEGVGKIDGIKWPDDLLKKVINEQPVVRAIPISLVNKRIEQAKSEMWDYVDSNDWIDGQALGTMQDIIFLIEDLRDKYDRIE